MIDTAYQRLMNAVLSKGYIWFTKPYDMNVVGIRNMSPRMDCFDDTLCVAYLDLNGHNRIVCMPCTTDPGLYYLENPINNTGTAILKEGQYRGSHCIGLHKGYTALVQRKDVTVYRDADRDKALDLMGTPTETGIFGINIHRAIDNSIALTVGRFSAGCQVIQSPEDFAYLISLIKRQKFQIGSDVVSYTLIRETDVR